MFCTFAIRSRSTCLTERDQTVVRPDYSTHMMIGIAGDGLDAITSLSQRVEGSILSPLVPKSDLWPTMA